MCSEKLLLMDVAQKVLSELAELMNVQRLKLSEPPDRMLEVDRLIENKMGEKERAMGALLQHRKEHGC